MISLIVLAALGCALSVYTHIIEYNLKKNPQYKPICDLSDTISCSKPFQSPYGHLFFISNAIAGIIYYITIAFLAFFKLNYLLFFTTGIGILVTLYLAYLLYFKIKSLCIICSSLYIINILLFICALSTLYQ